VLSIINKSKNATFSNKQVLQSFCPTHAQAQVWQQHQKSQDQHHAKPNPNAQEAETGSPVPSAFASKRHIHENDISVIKKTFVVALHGHHHVVLITVHNWKMVSAQTTELASCHPGWVLVTQCKAHSVQSPGQEDDKLWMANEMMFQWQTVELHLASWKTRQGQETHCPRSLSMPQAWTGGAHSAIVLTPSMSFPALVPAAVQAVGQPQLQNDQLNTATPALLQCWKCVQQRCRCMNSGRLQGSSLTSRASLES